MNDRITYLIGAGASANALPVIKDLSLRLRIFYEALVNLPNQLMLYASRVSNITSFDFNPTEDDILLKERIRKYSEILNEIESNYTVDTYARKLYLSVKHEKLNTLIDFLAAYFAFEQMDKNTEFGRYLNWFMKNVLYYKFQNYSRSKFNETIDLIFCPIDVRY